MHKIPVYVKVGQFPVPVITVGPFLKTYSKYKILF